MKNKYKNRRTGQIIYSDFILDEDKFESLSVAKNVAMGGSDVRQKKGRKDKKKK